MRLTHLYAGILCFLLVPGVALQAQEERHDADNPPAAQEKQQQDRDQKQDQAEEKKKDHAEEQTQEHKEVKEEHTERTEEHGRISEEKFRASFGREHVFRMERPVIVEGRPRFQYAGYWFAIAEPWPVGWAYADPVYIDYVDGGYWIYNQAHPGVRVSINVVF